MNSSPLKNGAQPGESGFTLLEMIVSMGVMLLIVSMSIRTLLSVHDSTMELTDLHGSNQESKMFWHACERAFAEVNHRSQINFDFIEQGSSYNTYLSFGRTPGAFQMDVHLRKRIDRVVLAAEHRADSWLRIGVYYLSEDEFRWVKERDFASMDSFPYLELISKAEQFSWLFYNARSNKWESVLRGFKPAMIELKVKRISDIKVESKIFELL